MTVNNPTRESGQEGSARESTRREFLGAAAAVAALGAGGAGGEAAGGLDDADMVYVDQDALGWCKLAEVVAADVWDDEFQELRLELLADDTDLDRAAELCRQAARRLEQRDVPVVE